MNRARILVAVSCTCLAVCFLASSCATSPSTGAGDTVASGTLRLLITDKPFPFEFIEEAVVVIDRIEVRREADDDENANENGNENENENGNTNENGNENENENTNDNGNENDNGDDDDDEEDDGDDGAWIEIFTAGEEGAAFNLLDLQNGRTDLLAEADIEAGTYTQTRIIVSSGRVTLTDGRVFDLQVPSGAQTGIKLHFTFEIEGDEETVLLLDVDLSRAFSAIPGGRIDEVDGIRNFRFQPSLAMRLILLLDAGSISGTVSDSDGEPVPDASVTAYDEDGEEVTSTSTEADGTYTLGGLLAGTYRVDVSATGFDDATQEDVAVQTGETTEGIDFVLVETAP